MQRHVTPSRVLSFILSLSLACSAFAACDSDDGEDCAGPEILPHQAPVLLGDFFPLAGNADPEPGDHLAVPFEWVLLLKSGCSNPVKIEKVCIVGDNHNGVEGDTAFTIEGPVPGEVPFGKEGAVRITYDHAVANTVDEQTYTPPEQKDQPGEWTPNTPDGEPDPDLVAVVVQSNAKNFPTLVIPVCARIVPDGSTKKIRNVCPELPDEYKVEAGQRNADLCQ